MKKEIFVSTIKRIKLIFNLIKLIQRYNEKSKEKNFDGLIQFLHTLSDPHVYTWEKDYINKNSFFAMNINLSFGKRQTSTILVVFLKNGLVKIKPDLNCYLPIDPIVEDLETALWHLTGMVSSYKHPELKQDEVFFGNIAKGFPYLSTKIYKTIRTGKCAFDNNGNQIKNMSPMFISSEEFKLLSKEIKEENKVLQDILKQVFFDKHP